MLRSKAIAFRATSERDELVREARRLANVVTNMPWIGDATADEAAAEIGAATREVDEIGRLVDSLDDVGEPEERATLRRLRELTRDARALRRRLREMRRDLLAEQARPHDLAA